MRFRDKRVLATRNLLRHTRRTLITAGAVAVGLGLYILIDSMLLGIEVESERNLIWFETGTAQVLNEAYLDERTERPLTYTVDQPQEIRRRLEEAGLPTTPRTVFRAELVVFRDPFPEDGSVVVTAYGIDPETDGEVYRLAETVDSGSMFTAGESGAVLGSWLAEDLGADIGYPITLVTRTRNGYYQTIDLEVVGLAHTPNPVINRTALFLPIDLVDEYLQMDGAVTELAIGAGTIRSTDAVTERASAEIAGFGRLNVVGWKELAADYVAIAEMKQSGSDVIMLLVFIITAVGISNTVLLSILERTRELGMLRAIGLRDREVFSTLMMEAAGIGVIGSFLGLVLGAILTWLMVNIGIDYGSMLRDMDVGYRITGTVYGAWHAQAFLQAGVMGVLLSVITAMIPIRLALKKNVVEALRTE